MPVISDSVQRKVMKFYPTENLEHLVKSLDMAHTIPTESESSSVELLIGNDYYLDIILSQKIEVQPGLYLLAPKLGWILTGVNETNMLILTYGTNIINNSIFTNVDKAIPVKPDLEDFWNNEIIGQTNRGY